MHSFCVLPEGLPNKPLLRRLASTVSLGVAVREFPTSMGPVDYALFVSGNPVGVIEAKKSDAGERITTVEEQSSRRRYRIFLNSWIPSATT